MENKNTELEEEGNFDLKPEHLLSFMALRTNFNRNKIENIVKSLMCKQLGYWKLGAKAEPHLLCNKYR
jgi:hypothetical protein